MLSCRMYSLADETGFTCTFLSESALWQCVKRKTEVKCYWHCNRLSKIYKTDEALSHNVENYDLDYNFKSKFAKEKK